MNEIAKKLKERNLPELLALPSGGVVKSQDEWERKLRPYYRELLEREEYGRFPEKLPTQISTVEERNTFAGKGRLATVSITLKRDGKAHTVPCKLAYPASAKDNPCPFFIYINFKPEFPDFRLPAEEIIDGGFGIFSVCYEDITTDDGDFENGIAGLFYDGERAADGAGKIVYWSYFTSIMMDYLQERAEADKSAIGISGHSRLGKTALLSAAFDERFAFCCPNNSGCSGVALSRGKPSDAEHIRDICKNFPFWFCPNYLKYVDNEDAQPFDQHCLVALVAPRAVFAGLAEQDAWADNDGQLLALAAATPVWELYGKPGLITDGSMLEVGERFIDGSLGAHLRRGTHYHSREDWQIYMTAIKRYLGK